MFNHSPRAIDPKQTGQSVSEQKPVKSWPISDRGLFCRALFMNSGGGVTAARTKKKVGLNFSFRNENKSTALLWITEVANQ